MDYTHNINFTTNLKTVLASVKNLNTETVNVSKATVKIDKAFVKTANSINTSLKTIKLSSIIQNINHMSDSLSAMAQPGLTLGHNLQDLSAIAGVTGDKLKEIEGYARDNAKTFGGSASQGVESYKLILSQLGPDIAKTPEALKKMGEQVSITSKLMGGDTAAATGVLTTAMNQYKVSLEDPIEASKKMNEMLNIMASGAKFGSAELPQIKLALEQSGMAAKSAGVGFDELNAGIQILDKAGKKGAEGGVALRNVISILGQGRFMPKATQQALQNAGVDIGKLGDNSLSLAQRLEPLKNVMNDQALISKMFGRENSNAALALLSGIDNMKELTTQLQGTNTAYEQAGIIMESPIEKNARLKARIDDLKISMFNATGGGLGYLEVVGNIGRDISGLIPLYGMLKGTIMGAVKAVKFLTNAEKMSALWTGIASGAMAVWKGIQVGFNAVMYANPVVWIVAGIITLIGVITYVGYKTEGWGKQWESVVNFMKYYFLAYVEYVKFSFNTMINGIMIGIDYIKLAWYKAKIFMGKGDEAENQAMINQINSSVSKRKQEIIKGAQKVADLAIKAKDALTWELSWNSDKSLEDVVTKMKGKLGMTNKVTPVVENNNDYKETNNTGEKVTENIVTGGKKTKILNINIDKVVDKIEQNIGSDSSIDIDGITDEIIENLIRKIGGVSKVIA